MEFRIKVESELRWLWDDANTQWVATPVEVRRVFQRSAGGIHPWYDIPEFHVPVGDGPGPKPRPLGPAPGIRYL